MKILHLLKHEEKVFGACLLKKPMQKYMAAINQLLQVTLQML